MEIAGFVFGAVSLATLFQSCVDFFEYVEAGRDMDKDLTRTFVMISLEKSRFIILGDRLGICEVDDAKRSM